MNVAFIPVRGGSKSIPLKNIKPICGKPLVYWTVKAACECRYIDKVYVSTDSEVIRNAVQRFAGEISGADKIEVIGRSPETATDGASTESAMLEFAEHYICLLYTSLSKRKKLYRRLMVFEAFLHRKHCQA